MLRSRRAWLPLILVLGWSLPGQAQVEGGIRKGTQTISGSLGGQFFDLNDELDDVGANFDTELNVGARYQYFLTDRWGVEGDFLFSRGNPDLARAARADVDVNSFYYNGNVIFNVANTGRFVPYVTGGAGAVTLEVSDGGDTETKFAFNFGGGLTYLVAERIAARVDARDYVYSVDDLSPQSTDTLGLPTGFGETIHDLAVTGGISLLF